MQAVQELSKMNDERNEKIEGLQKQVDELKKIALSSQNISETNSLANVTPAGASLEQNIPNLSTQSQPSLIL